MLMSIVRFVVYGFSSGCSSNYVCKPTFCVMPKKLGFRKGHPNPNPRRNGGLPHGVD